MGGPDRCVEEQDRGVGEESRQNRNKMTTKDPILKKTISLKKLRENNAKFHVLPEMEKRVAIAKEVILQLEQGRFVAGFGYGHVCSGEISGDDLQEDLHKGVVCVGCAKGACIAAKAWLGNDIDGRDIGYNSQALAHAVSYEIFGQTCADLIEALYENGLVKHIVLTSEQRRSFFVYADKLPVFYENKMKAIYQNIIDNNGHLKIGKYKF